MEEKINAYRILLGKLEEKECFEFRSIWQNIK